MERFLFLLGLTKLESRSAVLLILDSTPRIVLDSVARELRVLSLTSLLAYGYVQDINKIKIRINITYYNTNI